ncbi:hypothetical protein EVAR_21008_1 [Eumeta japonica]|uniref:Uncharacterized protein n=1 Tax=Eumeta variegata TaxID=151549 RepID=A0A4C1V6L8_EUMVA|nr:hypothetical protein EVAR_21008_1 [Eumeta japonica]
MDVEPMQVRRNLLHSTFGVPLRYRYSSSNVRERCGLKEDMVVESELKVGRRAESRTERRSKSKARQEPKLRMVLGSKRMWAGPESNVAGMEVENEIGIEIDIDRHRKKLVYVHAGAAAGIDYTAKLPAKKCRTTSAGPARLYTNRYRCVYHDPDFAPTFDSDSNLVLDSDPNTVFDLAPIAPTNSKVIGPVGVGRPYKERRGARPPSAPARPNSVAAFQRSPRDIRPLVIVLESLYVWWMHVQPPRDSQFHRAEVSRFPRPLSVRACSPHSPEMGVGVGALKKASDDVNRLK